MASAVQSDRGIAARPSIVLVQSVRVEHDARCAKERHDEGWRMPCTCDDVRRPRGTARRAQGALIDQASISTAATRRAGTAPRSGDSDFDWRARGLRYARILSPTETVAELRALIEQECITGITYRADIRRYVGHAIATIIESYGDTMPKYACPRWQVEEIASYYAAEPINRRDVEDAIRFWTDGTLVRIELVSKGKSAQAGDTSRAPANCYRWVGVRQYTYENDGPCPIKETATGIATRIGAAQGRWLTVDSDHSTLVTRTLQPAAPEKPPKAFHNAAEWLADNWFTPKSFEVPDWVADDLDITSSELVARMFKVRQSGDDVTVEAVSMTANQRARRSRFYVPDVDEVWERPESVARLRGFEMPDEP